MKKPIWTPSAQRAGNSSMKRFLDFVNGRYDQRFGVYEELYHWSITHIPDFWAAMWEFSGIIASRGYDTVVEDLDKMPGASWFAGSRLNFAENLLRYRDEETAIVSSGEGRGTAAITYKELYGRVAALAAALRLEGVKKGDRVAGFMPNIPETVIAMLATTSIGAVWSSCSPDFGIRGALDRFGQIEPKVLFTADGYSFGGRRFDSLDRIRRVAGEIDGIRRLIVIPHADPDPDMAGLANAVNYGAFLDRGKGRPLEFEQVPFEHPVYIMYSSGTTGPPKCMVQSVGGILLNHLKELMLHTDVSRRDTIFYYTTCGWMMWNWLVSSLALGAKVLLYDGSAMHPDPSSLWQLAQDEEVTIFGTSARYLAVQEREGVKPGREYDLSRLKTILSTGSPLSEESFHYVYRDIKQDVQLASISGGTDLNGCFALGNPLGPVFAGELQCRGLGMKVEAYDEDGRPVIGRKGELVCTAPFPSMPVGFWNDPEGEKYRKAYFSVYRGVWAHGDYIKITDTGGVVIYGRSDATLNPGGVRIGTAEIYRQMEALPQIADSLAVGQQWGDSERVILFVKMAEGEELTEELEGNIQRSIRENISPRHVPAKIIRIEDIPYTISMKKVELAVRKIIHGEPVHNRDALANPESLDLYRELEELKS
ncbi:MAG: acetoacetate--CoA ligase [Desulfobulbaceae bacterium]|nr:MAG: acetoacetate--CoA ligase [Desulfobulbaceae bacterium]